MLGRERTAAPHGRHRTEHGGPAFETDLVIDPGAAADLTNGTITVEVEKEFEHKEFETDAGVQRVFPVTG
ncbi:hypothetical protein IDM40_22030 [Nocardiopsis sp. HNM0947]|uniref:Uncharacterized protein n=1 Tax=Nocardiopsis coralli TaxID=2772213 RepID=A0ABR9PBZ4_9ACTN|nr:hypothetical protein [Nocardiopsis coralli]MBE3001349.1 hypothetical protein [Nocardiopsis coralli]